eukprot:gene58295-biopygen26353
MPTTTPPSALCSGVDGCCGCNGGCESSGGVCYLFTGTCLHTATYALCSADTPEQESPLPPCASSKSLHAVPDSLRESMLTSNHMAIYDLQTDKITCIDASTVYGGTGSNQGWIGAVAVGTTVYGIPCTSGDCPTNSAPLHMLILDTVSDAITTVDTSSVSVSTPDNRGYAYAAATVGTIWAGTAVVGPTIYALPSRHQTTQILVYDSEVESVNADVAFAWQTLVPIGITIIGAPRNDNNNALVLDTETSTATSLNVSAIRDSCNNDNNCHDQWYTGTAVGLGRSAIHGDIATGLAKFRCVYGPPSHVIAHCPAEQCADRRPHRYCSAQRISHRPAKQCADLNSCSVQSGKPGKSVCNPEHSLFILGASTRSAKLAATLSPTAVPTAMPSWASSCRVDIAFVRVTAGRCGDTGNGGMVTDVGVCRRLAVMMGLMMQREVDQRRLDVLNKTDFCSPAALILFSGGARLSPALVPGTSWGQAPVASRMVTYCPLGRHHSWVPEAVRLGNSVNSAWGPRRA